MSISHPSIVTFHGATAGAGTAGTIALTSDILQAAVNYIQIPRGMKAKIWAIRMSGAAGSLTLGFSKTVAAAVIATTTPFTPTVSLAVFYFDPTLDSWLNDNLRHPIEIPSETGGECIYVNWVNAGSVVTYFDMDVEFVPL